MHRKISLFILTLLFLIAYPAVTIGQATGTATASPDHITLTWTGNPATTMTITWRTDKTITTGQVEYQKGSEIATAANHATATSSDFTTDIQSTHLFTTTLTGLDPHTQYTYRIGSKGNWSTKHSFSTADPNEDNFRFLVFGDSQSPATNYSLWKQTLHNAYRANRDARFFVNVGDLVDSGQNGRHWNSWFDSAAGVIDTIPAMPVVGNHETVGSSDTRRPSYWKKQFNLPQNGPSLLKGQAYSYDYGPVHFVVLDSQQSEQKQYGDILTAQKKWLDGDLAASKAKWVIAFFHKGAYSLKNVRDNKNIRNAFCPIFDKYHVDLVFNAHDHAIGRTFPIYDGKYKSNPSAGTIYYNTGRSGTKVYTDVSKQDWDAFYYNPQDQPCYIVVSVAEDKLSLKTVKLDGTLIDTYSIVKK